MGAEMAARREVLGTRLQRLEPGEVEEASPGGTFRAALIRDLPGEQRKPPARAASDGMGVHAPPCPAKAQVQRAPCTQRSGDECDSRAGARPG